MRKYFSQNKKYTSRTYKTSNSIPTDIISSPSIEKNPFNPRNKFSYSLIVPNTSSEELYETMSELQNYMETITPSVNENTISSINANECLSFRPKNLPKKSKEEEEYHRKLVEENKQAYIEKLNKKQIKEQKYKKRLEDKRKKDIKLTEIWNDYLIPNWTSVKEHDSTRKFFYEGIPSNIRGKVWRICLGNSFSITKEYYQIQVKVANEYLENLKKIKNEKINKDNNTEKNIKNEEKLDKDSSSEEENILQSLDLSPTSKENSIEIIDLDIERTFPYLNIFKGNSPLADDLREILRTFVVSRPDIGYIQGLSFIAGMLLLNMDKFSAFISLMNLILNPIMLPFFKMENEDIHRRMQLFKQVFYYNLPELCEHFDELGLLPENYFLTWSMTLFTHDVNVDIAARIWDAFMVDGYKAIYSASVIFLSHFESEFLEMDFVDIMYKINSIKTINFDDDMLLEAMQKVKFPKWVENELEKLMDENIPI